MCNLKKICAALIFIFIILVSKVNSENTEKDSVEFIETEKPEIFKEFETTTLLNSVETESEEVSERIERHLKENLTIVVIEKSWETPGWLDLPENYDKNEVPKLHGNKPIKVAVFINIRGINQIDMKTEKITLDLDYYTFWADPRFHTFNHNETSMKKNASDEQKVLSVEITKLSPDFVDKIWTPDIIIENAVQIQHNDQTSEPIVSFNSETGFVRYKRIEVQSPCAMSFCFYPLDIQRCELSLKSYKYLNEHLELQWIQHAGGGVYLDHPHNPNFEIKVDSAIRTERVAKSLHFPNLLNKVQFGRIKWVDKSFDVLKFVISFRRNMSFHMAQTYSPSMFFIGITWLCFLLPPGMHASRVGITMTTLLTINTMFNSVRAASPQVSYATAIDVWMVACVAFAFLSLLLFTTMSWLDHAKEREEKHLKEKEEEDVKAIELEFSKLDSPLQIEPKPKKHIKTMNPQKLKIILKIRKFLKRFGLTILSSSFVAFNAIYWSWICIGSEYYQWEVNPIYNAA